MVLIMNDLKFYTGDVLVRELPLVIINDEEFYKCSNGKLLSKKYIDDCEIDFNSWVERIKKNER